MRCLLEEAPEECSYFLFSVVCFVCGILEIEEQQLQLAGVRVNSVKKKAEEQGTTEAGWKQLSGAVRGCSAKLEEDCVHFVYTLGV